jgi:hypothetical protein
MAVSKILPPSIYQRRMRDTQSDQLEFGDDQACGPRSEDIQGTSCPLHARRGEASRRLPVTHGQNAKMPAGHRPSR